ncbi:hypothetical protein Q5752_001563 [Cryptotrichosporon argae]
MDFLNTFSHGEHDGLEAHGDVALAGSDAPLGQAVDGDVVEDLGSVGVGVGVGVGSSAGPQQDYGELVPPPPKKMSAAERKERQRQSNRAAAERSRNRKREELTTLEMTVNNIQDENAALRARLSALLGQKPAADAAAPGGSAHAHAHAAPAGHAARPITVDYAALGQLQAELAAARSALLARELERAGGSGDGDVSGDEETRAALVNETGRLEAARTEVRALHAVVAALKGERDGLARQRDVLARELDARRAVRAAVDDGRTDSVQGLGAERALLEIRALLDGAIKSWDQTNILVGPDSQQ